jgi:hypothetical protein
VVRLALLVALAGCELFSVPDGVVGSAQKCTLDRQCPAERPLCDTTSETCVQCVVSPDCGAANPICDHGTCRGCIADADCSTVCLGDGTCADAARLVYASPAGGGDCSASSPCDLDTAIAHASVSMDVVKLAAGAYDRVTTISIGQTVTLAGDGAALHVPMPTLGSVIDVAGGDLSIVGIEIDANAQIGASCRLGGKLRLYRTRILAGSTGIAASPCALVVDRSAIANNSGTPISVSMGPVSITSSFIIGNGGGVALDNVTAGTIAGTTIAGNTMTSPIGCATSPGIAIASDIIFGNPPLDPTCAVRYSDLDPGYTGAGSNDVSMDPMFVSPPTDYHLQASSPLGHLGDPASTLTRDFDGDPRGSPPTPGADEI